MLRRSHLIILWLMAIIPVLPVSCARSYRSTPERQQLPSPWPYHHGGLASQGSVRESGFEGKLDIVWETRCREKPVGPLSIWQGCLILPGSKNKIRFYDTVSGRLLGSLKSHGVAHTGLVIQDSLAFFATSPRRAWLRCVNLRSGKLLWKRRIKDAAAGSILLDNRLIVSSMDGQVLACRPRDGSVIWTFRADGGLAAPVSYADGRIFQPSDDGTLYAISPADGSELYRVTGNGPGVSAVAVSDLVFAADMSGHVYGIEPQDGRIVWDTRLDGPIWTTPAVSDDRLFVGHSGGKLVALDAVDGRVLWRFDADEVIRASAIVVDGYVIVGTMAGSLFSLDADDGRVVDRRQLGSAVAWPPVSDGQRVFVATQSGTTICLGRKHDDSKHDDQ